MDFEASNNLERNIETRLGNGLDTLKNTDDIDTIIISGMGAHTAVGILKNNLKKRFLKTLCCLFANKPQDKPLIYLINYFFQLQLYLNLPYL